MYKSKTKIKQSLQVLLSKSWKGDNYPMGSNKENLTILLKKYFSFK